MAGIQDKLSTAIPKINYDRNMPTRGPGGRVLYGLGAATLVLGMLRIEQWRRVRKADLATKRRANVALVPFLQAEEDLRYLRTHGDKPNVGLTTWLAPFDVPYR
eukprot:CAMPEP_0170733076 /NCGR_PEP_ID=MMETSP0437-20130122/1888_1 /TAXON_ID=0 /ORGANISM="Sexangularia sp." /LENGTH=103 /DNA_ID=CAMNT_0011071347 /DNA_START=73 /DNA_END=384 /DNA_ORIENTATION=-